MKIKGVKERVWKLPVPSTPPTHVWIESEISESRVSLQFMPKSPSSGLNTPSEKTSEVTSPIQEAKKFLKGGTRAILIQKVGVVSVLSLFSG